MNTERFLSATPVPSNPHQKRPSMMATLTGGPVGHRSPAASFGPRHRTSVQRTPMQKGGIGADCRELATAIVDFLNERGFPNRITAEELLKSMSHKLIERVTTFLLRLIHPSIDIPTTDENPFMLTLKYLQYPTGLNKSHWKSLGPSGVQNLLPPLHWFCVLARVGSDGLPQRNDSIEWIQYIVNAFRDGMCSSMTPLDGRRPSYGAPRSEDMELLDCAATFVRQFDLINNPNAAMEIDTSGTTICWEDTSYFVGAVARAQRFLRDDLSKAMPTLIAFYRVTVMKMTAWYREKEEEIMKQSRAVEAEIVMRSSLKSELDQCQDTLLSVKKDRENAEATLQTEQQHILEMSMKFDCHNRQIDKARAELAELNVEIDKLQRRIKDQPITVTEASQYREEIKAKNEKLAEEKQLTQKHLNRAKALEAKIAEQWREINTVWRDFVSFVFAYNGDDRSKAPEILGMMKELKNLLTQTFEGDVVPIAVQRQIQSQMTFYDIKRRFVQSIQVDDTVQGPDDDVAIHASLNVTNCADLLIQEIEHNQLPQLELRAAERHQAINDMIATSNGNAQRAESQLEQRRQEIEKLKAELKKRQERFKSISIKTRQNREQMEQRLEIAKTAYQEAQMERREVYNKYELRLVALTESMTRKRDTLRSQIQSSLSRQEVLQKQFLPSLWASADVCIERNVSQLPERRQEPPMVEATTTAGDAEIENIPPGTPLHSIFGKLLHLQQDLIR